MKKTLQRLIPSLITLSLIIFLFRKGLHWHDLQSILSQAKWGWLVLALFWQASAYGVVTWLNEILLRHYGANVPFGKQYVIQLAMAFIEAAVPSAAVSGAVLRIRLLKPYNVSADVATVTTLVEMTLISLSVILLALPVAIYAALNGTMQLGRLLYKVSGIGFLFLVTILMAVQWRKPGFVKLRKKFISQLTYFWDLHIRGKRPKLFELWPSHRIVQRIHYLSVELVALFKSRPYAIFFSLLARSLFEALGLMMCFYALGQTLPLTTMILAYTLTIAVNMLGAVPGGVGLAEISLATLYTQFGLQPETAMAVAIAYRLTDYWLPRVAGGAAWLWLERQFSQSIPDGYFINH